ncbi:MAG: hypothetical protein KF752_15870 [Pirellulaceae bacterium]|nr:hypothetical protein [Pirellulaceae bacterium]
MAYRRILWIDNRVQGVLVGRVLIYWFATTLYFGVAIAVSQYFDHPDWSYVQHLGAWVSSVGVWLPSVVLLLPLVLFDVVRLSNQFVGPVYRLRQQLTRLIEVPNCTPMVLRTDDYWHDLIAPTNTLQNQLLSLQLALQKAHEIITGPDTNPSLPPASAEEAMVTNSAAEIETCPVIQIPVSNV